MKTRIPAVLLATTVLFGLASYALGQQAPDEKHDEFRRKMLPKVGQKITFVGTVRPGKFGVRITPDEWVGIEIQCTTTNAADLAKLNRVGRQQGRMIKVEGVLHLAKERPGPEIKGIRATGIPEHFFFDVAEISFSETKAGPDAKPAKK